jgi:hypothetical protein
VLIRGKPNVRIPRPRSKLGKAAAAAAIAIVVLAAVSVAGYKAGGERVCESCHEVRPSVDTWRASTHRTVACSGCHDDGTSLDPDIQVSNLGSFLRHIRGDVPEQKLLADGVLDRVLARCGSCHAEEAADWEAGPHGLAIDAFVLNETHNREAALIDDCLRCHGMHFQGGIGDLVGPLDTKGPWKLVREDMAGRPAVPCTACHRIHGPGEPVRAARGKEAVPAALEKARCPSLSLFDRRSQRHIAAAALHIPAMLDGARSVETSPDPRQGLCYQCHAPDDTRRIGTGNDRTPAGVHEGLSCSACHQGHGMKTAASCADCHPRLSNCGLDVATMDTTFRSKDSSHNIHTVRCADCHTAKVPERRKRT